MKELCYFCLDQQWEIKIHLLWGKCFNVPHWPKSHFTNGTRVGMVWLKLLILGTIDGVLLHCQVHLCKKNNLTITSQELLNKRESNNLHDELNYFTWFANNCQSCWKDDLIVYHNTYCLWQGQRQGPLQYHQQLLLHRSGELFFLILLYSFVCYFLFFMFIYLYNLQYLSVITIQSSGIRWIMG